MRELRPIEEHHFYETKTDGGKFVGRVREFEDIRTRPHASRLDARDDAITLTRERLRRLEDDLNPIRGVVPQ